MFNVMTLKWKFPMLIQEIYLVILSEPVRAGQGPLRRSPRLQFTAGPGRRHWQWEDNHWGNRTFSGRWPSDEDDLQWKTTFIRRKPSVEYDLQWKTAFGGRRPSVEDGLPWKTTFSGRRPSMEDKFWWKTILAWYLVRFAAFFLYVPSPTVSVFS